MLMGQWKGKLLGGVRGINRFEPGLWNTPPYWEVKDQQPDALAATSSYMKRVMELERLPLQQRQQRVEIVKTERQLPEKHNR